MKTHELKIWPAGFEAVKSGIKTFEVRNNDRGFEVGDQIILEEFRYGVGEYTGRTVECRIVYISHGLVEVGSLKEGYCVLGLKKI